MPHLRFRGLKKEEVMEVSVDLIDKLSAIMECPKVHFTLEHISSLYIADGEEAKVKYGFVEIMWFKRSDEIKQLVASAITSSLSKYDREDVSIYFYDMEKENYFKNGVLF